ncbi:MAG TPA: hypothetical protein VFV87_10775 [Pirellulaceae bacterium]|nr:hypothetical protein [Pirellulaceae bacterium]
MNAATRMLLLLAIVCGPFLGFATSALAQKGATSKSLGEHTVPFWSSKASSRRLTHARDYARDFHGYIVANPKPEPAVVKEATAEIGRNLEEAKKHFAQMKKDFAGDKDAVAGIEALDKQLAAAFEQHKMLGACCEKADFDAIETMSCCSDLASQLDKLIAAHDELMRRIASKPAAPTAKK